MKFLILSLVLLMMGSPSLASFGETYQLTIDENNFDIDYNFDGQILAMDIDDELSSLLIATDNVKNDSMFELEFSKELIRAEHNEFAILVNGFEVDYEVKNMDSKTKLIFPIFAFTEEVEIIGTKVIPEFPLGVLLVFGIVGTLSIFFSKYKKLGNNFI